MTSSAPDGHRRLVALVDCSAFYCSCERVFDPRLERVPVAVLSNNDGCVIARSDEVKAAGIKMGAPFFKSRALLAEIGAAVFSSNYTLYGDMSRRVMETLEASAAEWHPASEVKPYSIDEAFVEIPRPAGKPEAVREMVEDWAHVTRERVRQWTGIPVRVSVAETMTLAKAASEYARAQLAGGRVPVVCFTEGHPDREAWLEALDVEDVWGIARRWGQRLRCVGGSTAAKLARLSDRMIRAQTSVVGLRTAYELRGVPAVRLDDAPARRTLIRSRSFGERVTSLKTVEQAVATHAARAAEKLRREGLVAGHVAAFLTTKGYGDGPHRSGWVGVALDEATAHSPALIRAALTGLRGAYAERDGYGREFGYRKAGVVLSEIRPVGNEQRSLFAAEKDPAWAAEQEKLMAAVDALNRRFGRRAVVFGSMGSPVALRKARDGSEGAPRWEMRRERMTPRYTTRWDELGVVRG